MKNTLWDDLRQSLYNVFDHKLLENGAYVNIATGQANPKGVDLSKLYPVIDNELYDVSGYIWQSAFHNWVYESGIANQPTPVVCSGIYIDGVFTPKGNGIHVDYQNGRIVVNTPISTSSNVQAAFSYKEYSFVSPDNNRAFKNQTKFDDNSNIYINSFAASPDTIHLPAIFIEIDDADERGFQFGGTNETLPVFKLPLISRDLSQVEGIASIMCQKSAHSLPIGNALNGPKFDAYHDLLENYSFSGWLGLVQNFAYVKSVKYSRFYEAKSETTDPTLFGGFITVEISAIR